MGETTILRGLHSAKLPVNMHKGAGQRPFQGIRAKLMCHARKLLKPRRGVLFVLESQGAVTRDGRDSAAESMPRGSWMRSMLGS